MGFEMSMCGKGPATSTNKSWDLLMEAKTQGGKIVNLKHDNFLARGEMRWLTNGEEGIPLFRKFMEQERALDDRFQQEFMVGPDDPRMMVLTNIIKKEIEEEWEDSEEEQISQDLMEDFREMSSSMMTRVEDGNQHLESDGLDSGLNREGGMMDDGLDEIGMFRENDVDADDGPMVDGLVEPVDEECMSERTDKDRQISHMGKKKIQGTLLTFIK